MAMASKSTKAAAMGGTHTAGIYADMTVDGPIIGTLVAIVDRAKNLPNRKTMGKQDPYCAARLGKEAKKTETDVRGGQTPKWDQELRFTVHDSPDYFQLKVSVFNDDKKTDIIAETYINLESIIILGGGQSDQWHNLYFKGRYAGEVRLEMTYYDIRPKADQVPQEHESSVIDRDNDGQTSAAIEGPRQQQPPVKRRPLPSMPTTSDPMTPRSKRVQGPKSSPASIQNAYHNPSPSGIISNIPWGPDDFPGQTHSISQENDYDLSPSNKLEAYAREAYTPHQALHDRGNDSTHASHPLPYGGEGSQPSTTYIDSPLPTRNFRQDRSFGTGYGTDAYPKPMHIPSLPPPEPVAPIMDLPELPPYDPNQRRRNRNTHGSQDLHHEGYSISPATSPHWNQISPGSSPHYAPQNYLPSPQQTPVRPLMNSSPLRYESFGDRDTEIHYQEAGNLGGRMPPFPPSHYQERAPLEDYAQEPQDLHFKTNDLVKPEPLNIRYPKPEAIQASLAEMRGVQQPNSGHAGTYLPELRTAAHSAPPMSFQAPSEPSSFTIYQRDQTPLNALDRWHQSQAVNDLHEYEPSVASSNTGRRSTRQDLGEPSNHHVSHQTTSRNRDALHDTPQSRHSFSAFPQSNRGFGIPESKYGSSRQISPLPVTRSFPVTPDNRVPARKSVSPQPVSIEDEVSTPAIPFSPDSFDAYNPKIASGASSRHDTPECDVSNDVADDGPIIGTDGRVIDPSDHLPTSSWAPEPEKKPPRKGPEIKLRFRHSPVGAQPMPNTTARSPRERTAIRPQSTFLPTTQTWSPETSPTNTSGRNRLQKKAPHPAIEAAQPIQQSYASSPAPPSPFQDDYRGGTVLQISSNPSTPPAALREYSNGYNSSPSYGRSPQTYVGDDPLIRPAKILSEKELWSHGNGVGIGMGDLSEEMSRIDIGTGSARGQTRMERGRAW
ncbi:hypothetical protein MMC25_001364 [Agyrium rufum]|nr:hypothetical protein [Agyrium rufum]